MTTYTSIPIRQTACAVVFFHRTPSIKLGRFAQGGVDIDHQHYLGTASSGWTGFYDWLRAPGGRIIGVRFLPEQEGAAIRKAATKVEEGVCFQDDGAIEIFFSDARDFDAALSDDQSLGEAAFFTTPDGIPALAFDVADLTAAELQSLRRF